MRLPVSLLSTLWIKQSLSSRSRDCRICLPLKQYAAHNIKHLSWLIAHEYNHFTLGSNEIIQSYAIISYEKLQLKIRIRHCYWTPDVPVIFYFLCNSLYASNKVTGYFIYKYFLLFLKVVPRWKSIRLLGLFFQKDKHYIVSKLEIEYIAPLRYFPPKPT